MPKAALSARQQDSKHVQGMLNVAFTRARDEVHVFHSAPIDSFFKEDGKGAMGDWLQHIRGVGSRPRAAPTGSRRGRIDSEFESEVAEALRARGIDVTHQYPACGYWIDLVCELEGERVAVECDGEPWHTDEHGQPRIEDLERLAVLERAGWRVISIPYRKWLRAPGEQIQAVIDALQAIKDDDSDNGDEGEVAGGGHRGRSIAVTREQDAIVQAVRTGLTDEEEVLKRASQLLGNRRLGKRIRTNLELSASELNHLGLLAVEEGEYFLTPLGREAQITPSPPSRIALEARGSFRSRARGRSTSASRRTAKFGYCLCGGRWVLRTGRYGKFYGCSNYPRCRRTRSSR
ncbi:MAG: topoisomerase DNA-binding C4 zinc finger domain-containing protein [Actinomycetota bacterium]